MMRWKSSLFFSSIHPLLFMLWSWIASHCLVTNVLVNMCMSWCHLAITRIDNKQLETPRCGLLCDFTLSYIKPGLAQMKRNYCRDGSFSHSPSFFIRLSFVRSLTLLHCIFLSLGNDNGKWGSRPPYVPPRLKLTSALDAQCYYTIEQEISFFIGWLITLLWLFMSRRLRSVSSRFNLTDWRVYLMTAAQALLSAVTCLLRCLDLQPPHPVWFRHK